MSAFNRRRFLATTAVGMAGSTVRAAPAANRGGSRPVVIASGNGLTAKKRRRGFLRGAGLRTDDERR